MPRKGQKMERTDLFVESKKEADLAINALNEAMKHIERILEIGGHEEDIWNARMLIKGSTFHEEVGALTNMNNFVEMLEQLAEKEDIKLEA